MKRIYLFLLVSFALNTGVIRAQLELTIDTLRIRQIAVQFSPNIIIEDEEEGPIPIVDCSIHNKTDSSVVLYLSGARFYIEFNYQNKKYRQSNFGFYLRDAKYRYEGNYPRSRDTLVLAPNQRVEFGFTSWFFLGTPILKEGRKDGDYTLEMLEILPTLKIYYEDRLHKILASEVKYVRIRMGM